MLWCSATEHMMHLGPHWQAVTFGRTDMRYAIAFFSTTTILSVLGSLLYFYFAETLIAAACIILAVFILSISWVFGKHELNEIVDPIRKRYKMSMISSENQDFFENLEEATAETGQDYHYAKRNFNSGKSTFRKSKFMESLPDWVIKQAIPFLAISAPKWIVAITIGVLIIRFHEDIIPHGRDEQIQSAQNEVTLQIKMSGNTKKEDNDRNSVIDVSDYCMNVHNSSNAIILSNDGCN